MFIAVDAVILTGTDIVQNNKKDGMDGLQRAFALTFHSGAVLVSWL